MAESSFANLVLPHIAEMEPYTPIVPFEVLSRQLGRAPEQIVKLDANENPYGPHPAVRAALADYPFPHIYPDPEHRELRAALADYVGVPAEHILPGHGADELIDLICRTFLGVGDAVIDCPPTFGMYSFDAGLAGARVVRVPRQSDFRLDMEAIEDAVWRTSEWANQRIIEPAQGAARCDFDGSATARMDESVGKRLPSLPIYQSTNSPVAKLLFLASPNNPDGSLLAPADLGRLLELPLIVVLDEAYIEFAGLDRSVARWVPERNNLVVLRTFSKWAGLAGLRLGYGIFPAWLMPALWKAKQPYNVNVAATVAGLTSLAHRAEIQCSVEALVVERERLIVELGQVPFLQPFPSHANFVLCRVLGRDAKDLKEALAAKGILVRHYARPGLENCIRVSAGRPEDTDALLMALRMMDE